MTYDEIVERLGARNGTACCPAHDDRNPSLSVSEADDGKVLLRCHAGCSVNEIAAALGITLSDLFPTPPSQRKPRRHVVARYGYHDAHGELVYQVLRYHPKAFSQRRPDGRGGWIKDLHGVRRVLYRLPAVVRAVTAGQRVWITEGEKDADALDAIGHCATTNAGGADQWDKVIDAPEVLTGADVVIVVDRDTPGRARGRAVARSLLGHATTITVVEPTHGKDVAEHLGAGRTVEQLLTVASTAGSGVEPSVEEWLAAGPPGAGDDRADETSTLRLPERWFKRPQHDAIRKAAPVIGVTVEALVLAVIVLVGAHVPPAVVFPGRRRGVVNLLAALVGPPGCGKGTALDRALELVPPPHDARRHPLGSAQGLVKEFHRAVTSDERDRDKDLPPLVRHYGPVVVRDDEVGRFAARTAGVGGQDLIAQLKQAVFGEQLGQGVAAVEKNLRCAPHSYRLVGVVGVAPDVAGPLFDDIGGGLPQRVLFAPVAVRSGGPVELDPFDDDDLDDVDGDDTHKYVALTPIEWAAPVTDGRQSFADSRKVAARIEEMYDVEWSRLDVHVPYLTHGLAAVLAYFDGRWTIQPDDLTLAGDVVAVSIATRTALLETLERNAADGHRQRVERRKAEAVETTEATERVKINVARSDGARRVIALVKTMTIKDGRSPTRRDVSKRRRSASEDIEEAMWLGWLREEVEPTAAGGSERRTLVVTEGAP